MIMSVISVRVLWEHEVIDRKLDTLLRPHRIYRSSE